jgi:hypothetical protein
VRILVLGMLGFCILMSCEKSSPVTSRQMSLSWAELAINPQEYSGQTIRLDCKVLFGQEYVILRAPKGAYFDVWLEIPDIPRNEFISRGFERLVTSGRKDIERDSETELFATVIGKFSYKPTRTYGHLGAYQAQLVADRVVNVMPLEVTPK